MARTRQPTDQDRRDAIRIALSGIGSGDDLALGELLERIEPLHPRHNTFPGEVFLNLAADAIEQSGATRADPIDYEGIRERYLPERQPRGRAEQHKSHFALRAAAMIRAGVDPALLEEVSWWRSDDLWIWSFYALVVYVRVAADRMGDPIAVVCERVATGHGVSLAV